MVKDAVIENSAGSSSALVLLVHGQKSQSTKILWTNLIRLKSTYWLSDNTVRILEIRVSKSFEKQFGFPGAILAVIMIEMVTSIELSARLTTAEVSVTEMKYFGREQTAEISSEPNGGRWFKI